MTIICTSCNQGLLSPKLTRRPILIVKDTITGGEKEFDTVFSLTGISPYGKNENSTSYYLQKEFGMVGLNMQALSMTCLHLHQHSKRRKTKLERESLQACVDFGISQFIQFAQPMKLILSMGSEITKLLTGYNVSDTYGLICKSSLVPAIIIPTPNPDKLMEQPIGELRHALKVFAEQVKILEEYLKI